MTEVASLRYGVVFKKAFCDVEVFTAFVQDVLGIEFETDLVETEKEFSPPIGYIRPRFDLFAEDKKHRLVVDIQHERDPDHYDRFLYYHCTALLEQISRSEDYRPKLVVYTIVVLTSGDKHKRDIVTIDFDPRDRDGQCLGEIKHKVIYLCPKYVNERTPARCREWLDAINDSLDEQVEKTDYRLPAIHKVFDHIKKDLISPDERARIIEERKQQTRFLSGHEEGFAEGREEGLREATRELARTLLAEGFDPVQVARLTKLPEVEVQEIASETK